MPSETLFRKTRPLTSATSIVARLLVAERIQRADEVMSIDTEIERKAVAGAGGNADQRKPVCRCGCGDDGQRAVAAGDAQRIRAAIDRLPDERYEVVVRAQDDHVDPAVARRGGEVGPRRLAAARPGFMKSTGRCGESAGFYQPLRITRNSLSDALPTCSPAASSGRSRPWSRSQA